jgi:hypothetical protein
VEGITLRNKYSNVSHVLEQSFSVAIWRQFLLSATASLHPTALSSCHLHCQHWTNFSFPVSRLYLYTLPLNAGHNLMLRPSCLSREFSNNFIQAKSFWYFLRIGYPWAPTRVGWFAKDLEVNRGGGVVKLRSIKKESSVHKLSPQTRLTQQYVWTKSEFIITIRSFHCMIQYFLYSYFHSKRLQAV